MSVEIFKKLNKSIIEGNGSKAVTLTNEALKVGLSVKAILQEGLMPGIKTVGELFSNGEYYLPELLISGKAMQAAINQIGDLINEKEKYFNAGKYLIATVKGDVHDIGKNIVVMMLKSYGWKVTDLGVDIAPEKVCKAIKDGDFDIFGMSTLLTLTMTAAQQTIEAINKAGLRDKIKIMIGGAPVTQEFADKIGADAYGKDAFEAVTKALSLIGKGL